MPCGSPLVAYIFPASCLHLAALRISEGRDTKRSHRPFPYWQFDCYLLRCEIFQRIQQTRGTQYRLQNEWGCPLVGSPASRLVYNMILLFFIMYILHLFAQFGASTSAFSWRRPPWWFSDPSTFSSISTKEYFQPAEHDVAR